MSMEPTPKPETPRTGKYCPRCQAMAPRDQALCRQCGHQFRTGADAPTPETQAPDPMNRTMQFVLPPLRVQASIQAAPEPNRRRQTAALPAQAALFDLGRRRTAAAVLAALLFCLGAAWLWHSRSSAAALSDTSPAGVWETTLHGKASSNARLEFQFGAGGAGMFSWQESGPAAPSGRTPLRWKQNPDGTLNLALTAPPGGDSVSQILTSIFSRPAWPWRVDRAQGRLVLGTLVFTERP